MHLRFRQGANSTSLLLRSALKGAVQGGCLKRGITSITSRSAPCMLNFLDSLDKLVHYCTELLLGQVRRENLSLMLLTDVSDTTQATGQVHFPGGGGGEGEREKRRKGERGERERRRNR